LVRGRDHQTQIWFSGFRGDDLKVIFYQNMPNAVALSRQDGRHSAVALLLKAALIQVSDYRLLGASGFQVQLFPTHSCLMEFFVTCNTHGIHFGPI
jgi:hypothetical protein